jgi:teichuronic acid biosynthesis glycosyltransferase TuaG
MDTGFKSLNLPLVSVIVPNYNNGLWIHDCLNSILEQTYKNLEIIVADDCSTDDSPYILREYEKNYPNIVRCIYHNKNSGVSYNRHSAILLSKGEYITTLDADDYYTEKTKLEKEMELTLYYKRKYNKDIISYSNIVIERTDKTKIVQGNDKNILEGYILNQILSRNCMIPRDFIFSKSSYFNVGGYNKKLPIYEDWDLKIRIAATYEFYYTGITGTAYRQHGNGLSKTKAPRHIKYLKKVFKNNIGLVPKARRPEVEAEFINFIAKMRKRYIKTVSNELNKNIKNRQVIKFLKNYFSLILNGRPYVNPSKFFKNIVK